MICSALLYCIHALLYLTSTPICTEMICSAIFLLIYTEKLSHICLIICTYIFLQVCKEGCWLWGIYLHCRRPGRADCQWDCEGGDKGDHNHNHNNNHNHNHNYNHNHNHQNPNNQKSQPGSTSSGGTNLPSPENYNADNLMTIWWSNDVDTHQSHQNQK